MRRQEFARLGSGPGLFLTTLWSSGRLNYVRFVWFSGVICLVEVAVARRYLEYITLVFRDVSVMWYCAFWVGRKSFSAAGALFIFSSVLGRLD